jgi:hypothetical protein
MIIRMHHFSCVSKTHDNEAFNIGGQPPFIDIAAVVKIFGPQQKSPR